MLRHQLEGWALNVLDRVSSGGRVEDAHVEVKRDWPEAIEAARKIAAHANGAGGRPILWLIGVDEKAHSVPGADYKELADWFPRVRSQFDELTPPLQDLNIPYKGASVVALHFETDGAPFVVKNPTPGPIGWEVPWREGTQTRSARRANLLRLLSRVSALPDVEMLNASLTATQATREDPKGPSKIIDWHLNAAVYISPQPNERLAIPYHRCTGTLQFVATAWNIPLTDFRLSRKQAMPLHVTSQSALTSPMYVSTEAVIDYPSRYIVSASGNSDKNQQLLLEDALLTVVLRPTSTEIGVSVIATLIPTKDSQHWGSWALGGGTA